MGNVLFVNRYIIIYTFGVVMLLGFIISITLLYYIVHKKKLQELNLLIYMPIIAVCSIIFGKLFYIISEFYLPYKNIEYDTSLYSLYNFSYNYYGFLFGIILCVWIIYRKSVKFYEVLDIATILFSLILSFGWVGLFNSNINYGKETTLPIGVILQGLDLEVTNILVHPTQIYFAIFFFIMFIYLFIKYIQRVVSGIIFFQFLILSSFADFFLTTYLDYCPVIYNFCYNQYVDILIIIISTFIYVKKYIFLRSI